MAIKAGQIIHDAQGFVLDRVQTGGVSSLTIPSSNLYELGDYQTVAVVRDIPDLTFDVESTDVSTEMEAILTGVDPTTVVNGQEFDFINAMPIDVISPFKSRQGQFDILGGVVIPYLSLDSVDYKFGVKNDSTQSYTMKTDSTFYTPGVPRFKEFTLVSSTAHTYALGETATLYNDAGTSIYALSACVKNPTTKAYRRLFHDVDYTDTTTGITVAANWVTSGYTKLHVTYAIAAGTVSYLQGVNESVSVKPAAVRAKDVVVYVSDGAATPTLLRWAGVQSFEVSRKVNLTSNEEFDNHQYVDSDYDTITTSGSIGVQSLDSDDLFDKITQIADVTPGQVIGPNSSVPLEVQVHIKHPDTGVVLKTIDIPDARFEVPAIQGKVQTKLNVSFKFTSDTGSMSVFKGTP